MGASLPALERTLASIHGSVDGVLAIHPWWDDAALPVRVVAAPWWGDAALLVNQAQDSVQADWYLFLYAGEELVLPDIGSLDRAAKELGRAVARFSVEPAQPGASRTAIRLVPADAVLRAEGVLLPSWARTASEFTYTVQELPLTVAGDAAPTRDSRLRWLLEKSAEREAERPERGEYALYRARAFAEAEEYGAALKQLAAAVRRELRLEQLIAARWLDGLIRWKLNRLREARRGVAQALIEAPRSGDLSLLAGRLELAARDYPAALRWFGTARTLGAEEMLFSGPEGADHQVRLWECRAQIAAGQVTAGTRELLALLARQPYFHSAWRLLLEVLAANPVRDIVALLDFGLGRESVAGYFNSLAHPSGLDHNILSEINRQWRSL